MSYPKTFIFTTEGFPGQIVQRFIVNDDKLEYRLLIEDDLRAEAWVRPTSEQWLSFREGLNSIKIWDWNEKYFLPVIDGEEWAIEITYPDKHINSKGSNGYPGTNLNDSVEYRKSHGFVRFQASLYALMAYLNFEIEWEELQFTQDEGLGEK